jgi:hypothetical protein
MMNSVNGATPDEHPRTQRVAATPRGAGTGMTDGTGRDIDQAVPEGGDHGLVTDYISGRFG